MTQDDERPVKRQTKCGFCHKTSKVRGINTNALTFNHSKQVFEPLLQAMHDICRELPQIKVLVHRYELRYGSDYERNNGKDRHLSHVQTRIKFHKDNIDKQIFLDAMQVLNRSLDSLA